ncbi:MAG: hypothetical protein ACYSW3_00385 [Planctomycetota bacterium]|jgi:hypothetical protein
MAEATKKEATKKKVVVTWKMRSPVTVKDYECEKIAYANTGRMVMLFKKASDEEPFVFLSNFERLEVEEVEEQ